MDDANGQMGQPLVRFTRGPLTGRTFQLYKPVTTIGRDATNDISVKDDLQVSRKHAVIRYGNGVWSIEKLPNANIVMVNSQLTQQSAMLQDNANVNLGQDTAFVFEKRAGVPQPAGPSTVPASPYQQTSGPQPPYAQQSGPQARVQPSQPIPQQYPSQQGYGGPAQAGFPASQPYFPPQSPSSHNLPPQPNAYGTASLNPVVTGRVSPLDTVIGTPYTGVTNIPSLTITTNIDNQRQTFRLDKSVISVGKDNPTNNVTNDINVPYPIVSGRHLQIVKRGSDYVLIHPHPERQHTVNGLLYKGSKILGNEHWEHTLIPGDIFRIGNEQGTLITLTYDDGKGTQEEVAPPVQDIPLRGVTELTIGRRPDNKVVLTHPQVSGYHAHLKQEGGSYRITDLNSTNHVYVNNERTDDKLLKLGDEIRIGPYKLIYEGTKLTQYDESNFIRIEARNLQKAGNNNVTLIDNISLSIPPRKFVALVGGSGAGKSTLLDALSGLRPAQSGQVLYNGQDYYRNLAAFSGQLGAVPQDDIVHKDLTVERALYYAAKLRLPSDFTEGQIKQRIDEVLEDVEMAGRRSLLIKKLSGGQRKRVSIALELLANPSIFFLDEPTSGLDPGLDRKMMLLLRKLADAGHTIILVTHATNNIKTCDYICFLCRGGRLAYFGPPDRAIDYFGKSDFAEIYTSLEPTDENPNIPAEAEARFKLSPEYQEYVVEPLRAKDNRKSNAILDAAKKEKRVKRGNPIKQFLLLGQRNLELLKNDRSNLVILLLQAPLIVLVLMILVRFEIGAGVFDSGKAVQCFGQISQTKVVVNPQNPSPTQLLGPSNLKANDIVDCAKIDSFLKNDPKGKEYVNKVDNSNKKEADRRNKALQDFITTGDGVNALHVLFIIGFFAVLFGCINGTREVVKEASIYRRERAVNLGIMPYLLSKILVLGLFAVYQSAAILFMVQLFEPWRQGIFLPPLLEAYITLLLTAFAGLMIGLTASAFAANEDSANSLLPFLIFPQVLFAGVELPLKDYVVETIGLFFPTHWSMAALGSTIGLHADHLGGDRLFGNDYTYHGTLYSTFTQNEAIQRLVLSWGALLAIIIVLVIAMGIGLKRKDIRA